MDILRVLYAPMVLFGALELVMLGAISWPAVEDRLYRIHVYGVGSTRIDVTAVTGTLWRVYACVLTLYNGTPFWMEALVFTSAGLWFVKYLAGNILLHLAGKYRVSSKPIMWAFALFGAIYSEFNHRPFRRFLKVAPLILPGYLYMLYVPI
jgi:hypothetical protein